MEEAAKQRTISSLLADMNDGEMDGQRAFMFAELVVHRTATQYRNTNSEVYEALCEAADLIARVGSSWRQPKLS